MTEQSIVQADEKRLREILSERGLPTKIGVRLNGLENKIHSVVCAGYNFNKGYAELELPKHLLNKCGESFSRLWSMKVLKSLPQGKVLVKFVPEKAVITTTLKTAVTKDKGIFEPKINVVPLHISWARFMSKKDSAQKTVDWSRAERNAKLINEHTKQQINDGKTFNAQKDNPWARKHLKNKNQ